MKEQKVKTIYAKCSLKEWKKLKPKIKKAWREAKIKEMLNCPSYEKYVCDARFCDFCIFRPAIINRLFISGKEVKL